MSRRCCFFPCLCDGYCLFLTSIYPCIFPFPLPTKTGTHRTSWPFFLLASCFCNSDKYHNTGRHFRRSGFCSVFGFKATTTPMPTHHPSHPTLYKYNTEPSRVAPLPRNQRYPDNHQLSAAAAAAPGGHLNTHTHYTHSLSSPISPTCLLLDLIDYSPFFIYHVASSTSSGSDSGCQLAGWFWLWMTGHRLVG